MVTEAGKELLRNTINTAKFHNRILEENEMWKQWELERGLTMMVSDDLILRRIKKNHQCSKHRKRSKSRSRERSEKIKSTYEAGCSKEVVDRWDHNGFRELYPDEDDDDDSCNSPAVKNIEERWDHSGFLELYPEEAHNEKYKTSTLKEHPKKSKKKKRKHHIKVSTSDSEIWEEFKLYKRQKKSKHESERVPYDNHIREWKKQKN